jgi:apolipoprotein N-acyltransferase
MNLLLALFVGAFSAFAFEPFGLIPLMPLAFAALCELIARAPSLKRALLLGWSFGVGQFCIGLNWIATAFTFQAAMPAWLGWVAVVLLSLYLAVYPMLAAGLAWRWGAAKARPGDELTPNGKRHRLALVFALAGAWAVTEWLRATMFTGFAWNPVAAALVDTPWRETSATIGTYGLSLLVVLTGGMLWLASRRQWRVPLVFAAMLMLLLTLPDPRVPQTEQAGPRVTEVHDMTAGTSSSVRPVTPPPAPMLPGASRPAPPSPPVMPPAPPPLKPGEKPQIVDPGFHLGVSIPRIRIVQPNIGQADKWREGFETVAAGRLASLSQRSYNSDLGPPGLLFWPEAAVTEPLNDTRSGAAPLVATERAAAVRSLAPGAALITGGLGLTSSDGATVSGATNSVFVLDADGGLLGQYDKAHLVPYGEYLPMRPILSAIGLSRLAPGDLDFADGPGPRSIALPGGGRMGLQICYEIIFSGQVIDRANRPNFLFNPSNDAWFGAWGPPQHLAQARLRAAEEGIPVIRSTPTGISALIDARGRLLRSIPAGTAGIIDADMPPSAQLPPFFARHGNVIPLGLAFLLLFAAIALARRPRYRKT